MHLNLGFSLLTLFPGRVGGSESYVRGLLGEFMNREQPGHVTVLANRHVASAYRGQISYPATLHHVRSYRPGDRIASRALAVGTALALPGRVSRDVPPALDVLHYPVTLPIPAPEGRPSVVTLHDLQHHELPHLFSPLERRFRNAVYDGAARRADLVISLTSHVKDMLVERLGLPPEKVQIIPHGIDLGRFHPIREESDEVALDGLTLPERFLVYPANLWPHKNHKRLLQALAQVSDRELSLVLTGQTYGNLDAMLDQAQAVGVRDRVHHLGFVPPDAIPALYRRAEALIFPSLFEGFGAPPLEAMACGCPVASSTRGALHEVCGDAVVSLDPEDPESIAAAIENVTTDSELRAALRQAGTARASCYSWRTAAERHWEVYGRASEAREHEFAPPQAIRSPRSAPRAPQRPAATELDLSVVLVNHNGKAWLPAALAALASNTALGAFECVVVDSGSSDGSWEGLEARWPFVRVLRHEENIGFCVGCNRGAEAARGRLVAFVNFDGEVEPSWDEPLRRLLDDPTVQVATGLLVTLDGETIQAVGHEIAPNMSVYARQALEPRAAAPTRPTDVTVATGALMMVRKADFLALGGFAEGIWMYGEEVDYCLRALERGRIVFHPGSVLRHQFGYAAGPLRSSIRLYWSTRNRLINAARHLPLPSLIKSVMASAAFDLTTALNLRSRRAARLLASAWLDGLRGMPAARRERSRSERARATRYLVPLRDAIWEQRRLGRALRARVLWADPQHVPEDSLAPTVEDPDLRRP